MTVMELKRELAARGLQPYLFKKHTLALFGDTMKNYGCRKAVVNGIPCWELLRKKPVNDGLQDSLLFDSTTFEQVMK